MKFDPTLVEGARGRSPNCCAASHDGVINPNIDSSTAPIIPTSIAIGSDSDVSDSLDESAEKFAQFHPEGVEEVAVGSKIMKMIGTIDKHLEEPKKGKGFGKFFNRLAGKGKGAEKKNEEKKSKSTSTATYNVNDSDIESDSDDDSS
ncbi:MAG: hypothetical protein SGARI_000869, partial [Bacillariaceae sp.]